MSSGHSNKIFESIKNSDNSAAIELSENVIDEIEDLVDQENSTVLHVAANNNNLDMAEYYLKRYCELITTHGDKYNQESKVKWLKARDNEGFTCLHYAVFRGNFKMASILEQNGADIYQINNQGLSVLHIAAQGDSPLLMFYFLNKGLKISVTDSKGSTPLHWACYSGMENAAYALISWGAEIDKQETTFGMTPLHLATMSGNGRIVKKLLLKGCDRNIRAFNGKLALDIAKENEYKNISDMIIDKQGIEELMNIKTPFRKLHKHTLPFYLLLFLYLSCYILNISFVIHRTMNARFNLSIIYLVFGMIVGIFFIICKTSNPGHLKPRENNSSSMFQILLKRKSNDICFDCKIEKPERSRHCEVCDSCICVYDHHCPWVANCIGAKNYWAFYSFLISILMFMFFTLVYEIINLVETEWKTVKILDTLQIISEIYSLIICTVFILPLIFLIIVQTKNLLQNKTTFERYGYSKSNSLATTSQSKNSISLSSNQISSVSSSELRVNLISNVSNLSNVKSMEYQGVNTNKRDESQESNGWFANCNSMCCGNGKNIKYQIAF